MRIDPEPDASLPKGAAFAAERQSSKPVLFAAGLVVALTDASNTWWIAVTRVHGRLALPRVLLHPGETDQEGARRAYASQVGGPFPTQPIEPLVTLEARLDSNRLVSSYWRWDAPRTVLAQPSRCDWLPWEVAIERLALPEEQTLLAAMNDPLAQPLARAKPHGKATPSPGAGPQEKGSMGAALKSARAALDTDSHHGDWRVRARAHLDRAGRALEAGEENEAENALAAAWKLEFEARSVSERRLWTRLLQGEVRASTRGYRREALLAALEEVPDAGTLARIRLELDRLQRARETRRHTHQRARWIQMALVVPPCLALVFLGSRSWLSGEPAANETLLPAVLGLGLVGGFAWSALRQTPRYLTAALAPLLAGILAALLGFLLEQAGFLRLGQGSQATTLALALAFGFVGAWVWGLKRPLANDPPNA